MLNYVEATCYLLALLIFLGLILRSIASKRRLKIDQEIYLVVENSKSLIPLLNNKIFTNASFLILTLGMGAYAVMKRMYVDHLSSFVSVYFCLSLAYFEWSSSQQKMVVTNRGINTGVDYVDWENVESYFWEEDAFGGGLLLRVRRRSKIPFSFRVNQSDQEKLDQLMSSRLLKKQV